jgi:hypothetical protein
LPAPHLSPGVQMKNSHLPELMFLAFEYFRKV